MEHYWNCWCYRWRWSFYLSANWETSCKGLKSVGTLLNFFQSFGYHYLTKRCRLGSPSFLSWVPPLLSNRVYCFHLPAWNRALTACGTMGGTDRTLWRELTGLYNSWDSKICEQLFGHIKKILSFTKWWDCCVAEEYYTIPSTALSPLTDQLAAEVIAIFLEAGFANVIIFINVEHARAGAPGPPSFSSPKAALLLVSTKKRPTQEVRDSRTYRITLSMLRVKSDNLIGWEYETTTSRMLRKFDIPKGRDSWCWPKGVRPLGTRMDPLSLACTCRGQAESLAWIDLYFVLVKMRRTHLYLHYSDQLKSSLATLVTVHKINQILFLLVNFYLYFFLFHCTPSYAKLFSVKSVQ